MMLETGIISFAIWLASKIADKGFDSIYSKLTKESEFDSIFNKCVEQTANKLEKKYPDILGNSIHYFFTQEEVFDELCKLLFVNQDINLEIISETFHEASLPHNFMFEFISELKTSLTLRPEFQKLLANKELFIAVKGISKDLKDLVSNSSLTLDEVKKIKKILQKRFKSKFSLDSFLTLYRKNLVNNLGTVNFIGLGIDPSIKKGKRKELENIFVKPFFRLNSKYHIELEKKFKGTDQDESGSFVEQDLISYSHLFDRPYNYVILGNPGAGKTLLLNSIVCNIAKNGKEHFTNKRITTYIPFKIDLKNYLAFKKTKGGNLLKYLTYSLEEEYSVPSILEDNLSSVLTTERAIILFDGLDEIFDASDKTRVKNDIENFHNVFPKIRSITTSRFIGYNEVKLTEEKFCELNIMAFNNTQIEDYVRKWYSLEEEDVKIRNIEANDFISKMGNVDNELISNPLLLSLIVILYRNNLKIPESKLEIYQSCTNTLVDKWDASKNLDIELGEPIIQKKEPIFSDLAFWQYEFLSSKNTTITYNKAKETVASSLIKKGVADEYNCQQLAESFLNYAHKRSIYFDNNFTHKTFLEYYTAYWIYSNIEKKHKIKDRNKLIKKYIANPFWFIVLELLFNMIDKDQPDSDIMDTIFTDQMGYNNSLPFLIYILPNIKNISIEVSTKVYEQSIKFLISTNIVTKKQKNLFDKIIGSAFIESQCKCLITALDSIEEKDRDSKYYILINELNSSLSMNYYNIVLNLKNIKDTDHYREAIKKDPYLYQLECDEFEEESEELIFMKKVLNYLRFFGSREIFNAHKWLYEDYQLAAFIEYYFFFQLKEKHIIEFQENLKSLEKESVSIISLIKFLLQDRFLATREIKSLNQLVEIINEKDTTDKEKLLFIIIIKNLVSHRYIYILKEKIEIHDLNAPATIKGLLKNIKKIKSNSKYLDIIIKELNLKDKEVLQLTKAIRNKRVSSK